MSINNCISVLWIHTLMDWLGKQLYLEDWLLLRIPYILLTSCYVQLCAILIPLNFFFFNNLPIEVISFCIVDWILYNNPQLLMRLSDFHTLNYLSVFSLHLTFPPLLSLTAFCPLSNFLMIWPLYVCPCLPFFPMCSPFRW